METDWKENTRRVGEPEELFRQTLYCWVYNCQSIEITMRQNQTKNVVHCSNNEAINLFNNLPVTVIDCLTDNLKSNSHLLQICFN